MTNKKNFKKKDNKSTNAIYLRLYNKGTQTRGLPVVEHHDKNYKL